MKIICVGRNYAEHAREMGAPAAPSGSPVIFLKPDTARFHAPSGDGLRRRPVFYLPDFSQEIHYEVELAFRICRNGKNIQEEHAGRHLDAHTAGIDFTARDIQRKCKEEGLPWELSKAFDHSAALGRFVPADRLGNPDGLDFSLRINGKQVQRGRSADMLYSPARIVSYVSRFITLYKWDIVFTGTPAGVGLVNKGDILEGFVQEEKLLELEIG